MLPYMFAMLFVFAMLVVLAMLAMLELELGLGLAVAGCRVVCVWFSVSFVWGCALLDIGVLGAFRCQ